jgi:predicted metalloprotease
MAAGRGVPRITWIGFAVVLLVAAACTLGSRSGDGGGTGSSSGGKSNAVVTRALKDIERYWKDTYPKIGKGGAFTPVRGGYFPYTRTDPPPSCGGEPGQYQPNAFYCPDGDFIAWDAQTLIPQLQADYGTLLVGVVFAHEYGHAVQARLGVTDQPTVVLEQQADCFAGAWTADVLAGHSTAYSKITPGQLDNTVAGLLMLRDQPGTSAEAPQAHGNAFDRIRAFQDGVQKGVETCAGYREGNIPVTEVPFSTQEEAASGGDLPYDQAVNLLSQDAQGYWTRTYPKLAGRQWATLRVEAFNSAQPPSCSRPDASAGGGAFYCADGDFAAFDNSRLGPTLYENIGDFAVGMLLGDLFARAAQDRRGASTQDRAGQLEVDCLAGAWTNELLNRRGGDQGILLSPGDLDEAVAALLAFGRVTEQQGATAFDRIASYRTGVLKGLSPCT